MRIASSKTVRSLGRSWLKRRAAAKPVKPPPITNQSALMLSSSTRAGAGPGNNAFQPVWPGLPERVLLIVIVFVIVLAYQCFHSPIRQTNPNSFAFDVLIVRVNRVASTAKLRLFVATEERGDIVLAIPLHRHRFR